MLFRVYWGFEPIIYARINATIPINCMHTTKSNLQSLNIFQDKELLVTIVFTISKGPMRRLDDNPALFLNLVHVPTLWITLIYKKMNFNTSANIININGNSSSKVLE